MSAPSFLVCAILTSHNLCVRAQLRGNIAIWARTMTACYHSTIFMSHKLYHIPWREGCAEYQYTVEYQV